MKEMLEKIRASALECLNEDNADPEAIRIRFLGKKGELTAVLRGMGALSAEELVKIICSIAFVCSRKARGRTSYEDPRSAPYCRSERSG